VDAVSNGKKPKIFGKFALKKEEGIDKLSH
jgi:hypothetical protein